MNKMYQNAALPATVTDKEMKRLILKAREVGLDRDLKFVRFLNFLKANPGDIGILTFLLEMLEEAEMASLADPLHATSPNKNENIDGNIVIGQTTNSTAFGLNPDELNRHLLLAGSSGTGKSAIMKLIAAQIITSNSKVRVAIFAEKRNFRSLMRLSEKLVVIPARFLRLAYFRNPRSTNLDDFLSAVISFFGEVDMRFPSLSYMREVVNDLCLKWDYTGLPHQSCPNLADVYEAYRKRKHHGMSEFARYKERGESRLGGVLQNSGKIFKCDFGISFEKLWNRHFIIELDGLYPDVKKLIKSLFLAHNYFPKQADKNHFNSNQHLIMIDEGQELFRRNDEFHNILPFYDRFVAMARESRSGLAVGSQIYSDLSLNIRSNTSTKIATGFADKKDLNEFCQSIGIADNEQRAYIGRILKPGTALVSTHKYPDPFLINIPYLGLDFDLSDNEVLERLNNNVAELYHESEAQQVKEEIRIYLGRPANAVALLSRPVEPTDPGRSAGRPQAAAEPEPQVSTRPSNDRDSGKLEKALKPLRLMLSKEHPYIPQTKLLDDAGIPSGSGQKKTKQILTALDLIEEYEIWKGRSRVIFWKPTPKAYRLLGLDPPKENPNPGYMHQAIAKHMEIYARKRGYEVFHEWRLSNNRFVDLMIRKKEPEEMIFIEIGMSSAENELANAVNDLSAEIIPDKLILACKDKPMKKMLERLIVFESRLSSYKDKIEVVLAGNFIQMA